MPPMPPDLLRRPLRPDPAVLRSRLPAPPPLPAPRRPHPIHWPAVGVASAVCLLVLGGLSAWLATHPGKARQRPAPVPLAASPAPVIHVNALDREPLEVTPVDEPQPPRGGVRFANLTPPAAPAAQPPRPGIRILRPVQLANLAQPPGAPACRTENYGTSVKFLGSPQEAARAARREQKLLFVLHISGNFEDQQFTWNNAEALRVNALANDAVGKYLNGSFVSSYQKVATFRIVGGQKQGGNVASYFCTPDGRVIHAIAGPVNADTLLREARWAVETYKLAQLDSGGDATRMRSFFWKAHANRLRREHGLDVNGGGGRRVATNQGRVHLILTAAPLARLDQVYKLVFEKVLNEQVSTDPVVVN